MFTPDRTCLILCLPRSQLRCDGNCRQCCEEFEERSAIIQFGSEKSMDRVSADEIASGQLRQQVVR